MICFISSDARVIACLTNAICNFIYINLVWFVLLIITFEETLDYILPWF